MIKTLLLICLLAVACLCGCSAMLAKSRQLAKPPQLSTALATSGTPPARALRVMKVYPDSPASAAGIQVMDLITQYGDYEIVDRAGFYTAKNHYEDSHVAMVEIVVWRGRSRMTVEVRSGWLGVNTTENDRAAHEFSSMMMHLNVLNEVPKYQRDREFKVQFIEGPEKILEQATALIDKAERESAWTPAQVQVARIYMILDEAPEEDQKRQKELLKQLLETQPQNFTYNLGNQTFFENKRYRPAIACFNRYLKTSPDDVSIRLNLAVAYNMIGMYNEAEAAVDYVFDHNLKLSEFGHLVGYQAKALAALGRKDYSKSIQFAEKALAISPEVYTLMVAQLAEAQTGDLAKVEETIQSFLETLPGKYLERNLEIDAVHAYALVKNNQQDAARKLVKKWSDTDRSEGRVADFWEGFPGGVDIVKNWNALVKNQTR